MTVWGGCINTQRTMCETSKAVYREVRERIDIFNKFSGLVGNAVHHVQDHTPVKHVLAMFKASKDSRQT
jgi:hypothetical protein